MLIKAVLRRRVVEPRLLKRPDVGMWRRGRGRDGDGEEAGRAGE